MIKKGVSRKRRKKEKIIERNQEELGGADRSAVREAWRGKAGRDEREQWLIK